MKTAGIILVCFGILNFLVSFAALGSGEEEAFGRMVSSALMFGGIGAYLIHRANQKKKDEEEKERWNKGM